MHPHSQTMRLRHSLILLAFASVACKETASDTPAPPAVTPTSGVIVLVPNGGFNVNLPGRWENLYRVDTLSTPERGMARPGAINIVYLPQDTTIIPQTLVVVAVYDSLAWQQVKAAGGPPPGDSVKAVNGRVYVLGMPQSNPFAPGSVDALKFDSLALTPAEKERIVIVP